MAWLKRRWPILVVAIACGLFLAQSEASVPVKVIAALVCAGGVLAWNTVRNLRAHTTVNRLAALGQPEAMLAVVESELAASSSAQVQVPFTIYKATALALQGLWTEALALLDQVQPAEIGGAPGRTWRFLHACQRVHCLCLVGRGDEAEELLRDELEPFARTVPSPATEVIVKESRAKVACVQGRHEDSRSGFERLLEDQRMTPVSRAVYHYFLALTIEAVDNADGADDTAAQHRARAAELAPDTFMGQSDGS